MSTTPGQARIRLQGPPRSDVRTLLAVWLFVLFTLPADLTIPALRSFGTPAILLAVAVSALIPGSVLLTHGRLRGSASLGSVVVLFVGAATMSVAASLGRHVDPAEAGGLRRTCLRLVILLALMVAVAAGLRTRRDCEQLLIWVTWLGGFVAVLGILQQLGVTSYSHFIERAPFLAARVGEAQLVNRGSVSRVFGTAAHPIEFGVIMAAVFPLALARALSNHSGSGARWVPVILTGAALPLAVSRSALVGLLLSLLYLGARWDWGRRLQVAAALMTGAVILSLLVPGLYGAFRYLIVRFNDDSSVTARTADYGLVSQFFGERPIFGRGIGTFTPDIYPVLDNQLLLTLVEQGLVGVVTLSLFLILLMRAAARARRSQLAEGYPWAAEGLGASFLAIASSLFTFDLFSFSSAALLWFFLAGSVLALERLTETDLGSESVKTTFTRRLPQRVSS